MIGCKHGSAVQRRVTQADAGRELKFLTTLFDPKGGGHTTNEEECLLGVLW